MLHGTGMFTYIWLKFMVNLGKHSIHSAHMGGANCYVSFRESGYILAQAVT